MQLAAYKPSTNMQLTALACHPSFSARGLRHYSGGPRRCYGRTMRVRTSPTTGYYRLRSRSGSFLTARHGSDQLMSDYITYRENFEDKIGVANKELRALSQLVDNLRDICVGFQNDHMDLTRKVISRIALNMEVTNHCQGRGHNSDGLARPSRNAAAKSQKPHNRSRSYDRRCSRFGDRVRYKKSTGSGKPHNSNAPPPNWGARRRSGESGQKPKHECKCCSMKSHFAKDCKALVPVCAATETPVDCSISGCRWLSMCT
jgi:hypothetical protein